MATRSRDDCHTGTETLAAFPLYKFLGFAGRGCVIPIHVLLTLGHGVVAVRLSVIIERLHKRRIRPGSMHFR
ncbi:hypothetical protein GOC10_27965 [Sinorhizobium meliloti]|nr:hypothetical protein [Sinorhizobium meliloti]MDW9998125.1 hypothetical protein [Sinorhizobium meliloti]